MSRLTPFGTQDATREISSLSIAHVGAMVSVAILASIKSVTGFRVTNGNRHSADIPYSSGQRRQFGILVLRHIIFSLSLIAHRFEQRFEGDGSARQQHDEAASDSSAAG